MDDYQASQAVTDLLVPLDDWITELCPGAIFRGGCAYLDDPVTLFVVLGIMLDVDESLMEDCPTAEVLEQRVFRALGERMNLQELVTVEVIGHHHTSFQRSLLLSKILDQYYVISYRSTEDTYHDEHVYLALAVGGSTLLDEILAAPEKLWRPERVEPGCRVERVFAGDLLDPAAAARLASHLTGLTVSESLVC